MRSHTAAAVQQTSQEPHPRTGAKGRLA